MTENILMNPTEHPVGTEFVHRVVGDYLINSEFRPHGRDSFHL
jgi:hypothetical protein